MGCYGNRLHYTQHSAFDLVSTAWYCKHVHVHIDSAGWYTVHTVAMTIPLLELCLLKGTLQSDIKITSAHSTA